MVGSPKDLGVRKPWVSWLNIGLDVPLPPPTWSIEHNLPRVRKEQCDYQKQTMGSDSAVVTAREKPGN
ncbi:unnamed protein product [Boreogadus saida]